MSNPKCSFCKKAIFKKQSRKRLGIDNDKLRKYIWSHLICYEKRYKI